MVDPDTVVSLRFPAAFVCTVLFHVFSWDSIWARILTSSAHSVYPGCPNNDT